MIQVDFSTAVALYLLISIFSILFLWVCLGNVVEIPSIETDRMGVKECAICLHTYIDSCYQDISQCPRCGSYTKKEEESES